MTILSVNAVFKSYQNQSLLNGITFNVAKNEIICLLGPSGSGKSTILRIIAGLERPEQGQILWQGRDISLVPANQRHFGLMFQDYALFPHLNVRENVAFGLRMQRADKNITARKVADALDLVNMKAFSTRRVTDLSGGEQQRVALARALAPNPQLLMLDEPLGALDRSLREKLGEELRGLLRELKIPAIYVTHDQQEAFSIADRVLVLHDGVILQSGSPFEVYHHPASPWLAAFFGMDNQIRGRVTATNPLRVATDIGEFESACNGRVLSPGDAVTLVFKPDGVSTESHGSPDNLLTGNVVESVFSADRFSIKLDLANNHQFEFFSEQEYRPGEDISLYITPESILCFGGVTH